MLDRIGPAPSNRAEGGHRRPLHRLSHGPNEVRTARMAWTWLDAPAGPTSETQRGHRRVAAGAASSTLATRPSRSSALAVRKTSRRGPCAQGRMTSSSATRRRHTIVVGSVATTATNRARLGTNAMRTLQIRKPPAIVLGLLRRRTAVEGGGRRRAPREGVAVAPSRARGPRRPPPRRRRARRHPGPRSGPAPPLRARGRVRLAAPAASVGVLQVQRDRRPPPTASAPAPPRLAFRPQIGRTPRPPGVSRVDVTVRSRDAPLFTPRHPPPTEAMSDRIPRPRHRHVVVLVRSPWPSPGARARCARARVATDVDAAGRSQNPRDRAGALMAAADDPPSPDAGPNRSFPIAATTARPRTSRRRRARRWVRRHRRPAAPPSWSPAPRRPVGTACGSAPDRPRRGTCPIVARAQAVGLTETGRADRASSQGFEATFFLEDLLPVATPRAAGVRLGLPYIEDVAARARALAT